MTIVFSAYKRKKYTDIFEAAAIRQLKKEVRLYRLKLIIEIGSKLSNTSERQSSFYRGDTVEFVDSKDIKRIARIRDNIVNIGKIGGGYTNKIENLTSCACPPLKPFFLQENIELHSGTKKITKF